MVRTFPGYLVLSLTAATAPLLAQNDDSRGVLAGSATAIFVDGPSPSGAPDGTTLFHPNGFSLAVPLEFPSAPAVPDLRAILTFWGAPSTLDIDDFSTGRDEILVDENGVLDVGVEQWSVWSFSLRDGAVGEPGSRIAMQVAEGEIGSALFSYVLPGSGLPAEVVGVVERSHSGRELGVEGMDVDAVDVPLSFGLDQNLLLASGQPVVEPGVPWNPTPAIYFTVSHATRDLVPGAWWGGSSRSGATILCTQRNPFTGGWTQPSVAYDYASLGLGQDEDIDALAFQLPDERVLFSCVGNARDQFLVVSPGTDGASPPTPVPVVKTNGTRVSSSIGKAENDDVDAICTLDPRLEGANAGAPGGDDFGSTCGEPRPGLLGLPELSGSAWRRYEGGSVRFDSWMVGWPAAYGPSSSLAACFLTTFDNLDHILIDVMVRDPFDPTVGNPQQVTVQVPNSLWLSGDRVTFRWAHLHPTPFRVFEAWPVQVYL